MRFGIFLLALALNNASLRAEDHTTKPTRPVDDKAAACGLPADAIKRDLVFLANHSLTNVSGLIKQGIDLNRLGDVGGSAGLLLCFEMGKAVITTRSLGLMSDDDKKKVEDICTQSRIFNSLSRENLMSLKEITEKINQEVDRRYFPK